MTGGYHTTSGILTYCLNSGHINLHRTTTPNICTMSNWLKMVRTNTRRYATQMVKFKTCGDDSTYLHEHHHMGKSHGSSIRNTSITKVSFVFAPDPAWRLIAASFFHVFILRDWTSHAVMAVYETCCASISQRCEFTTTTGAQKRLLRRPNLRGVPFDEASRNALYPPSRRIVDLGNGCVLSATAFT